MNESFSELKSFISCFAFHHFINLMKIKNKGTSSVLLDLFNLKPRKSVVKKIRGKVKVCNLPQLGVHPLGGAAVRPLPGALSELRIEPPPPAGLHKPKLHIDQLIQCT